MIVRETYFFITFGAVKAYLRLIAFAKVIKKIVKMKAGDILSPRTFDATVAPDAKVSADLGVTEVLPRLLDAPGHVVAVTEGDTLLGYIDETSLLQGLEAVITPRDDSSTITLTILPADYSASRIARAVEDADVHLVDLWTAPADEEHIRVTLRIRTSDPSAVINSLERYGYTVDESTGPHNINAEIALERLLSLQALLSV